MPVTASSKQNKPFIIGVAGGSGSGKTYFARALQKAIGVEHCELIYQDNFYIDQSARFDHDGGSVNFDHPDAIEFSLLAAHLRTLKSGQHTAIPIYDFVTHSRKPDTLPVQARPIIIVDGILIFHPPQLRALFDDLIFFDTPEELRFQRRLDRDVHERGRTPEGVHAQFFKQVKPMHDQFVAPSMSHANIIVRDLGEYEHTLQAYLLKLRALF
jgi:uridine kinase